jgi:hypothetical protein
MTSPSFKIILCAEVPEGKRDLPHVFSIECGLHDGVRHFDHHKPEHRANPSPANNSNISWYWDGKFKETAEIYVTHVDADTFIGVGRLVVNGWRDRSVTGFDYSMIEKIDLNGSSCIEGPLENCSEYLFALGLSENAKVLFPRCTKEPQDITKQFCRFEWFDKDRNQIGLDRIILDGRMALARSEKTYREKRLDFIPAQGVAVGVGLWSIDANDPFDPSRPYRDAIDVVVVFRSHYKTISIYGNPATNNIILNHTWAGIEFAGHPKACGSPRGIEMTEAQARAVFQEIVEKNA